MLGSLWCKPGSVRRLITSCRGLNGLALPHRHGATRSLLQQWLQQRHFAASRFGGGGGSKNVDNNVDSVIERMGKSLQEPAGLLYGKETLDEDNEDGHRSFIPQVPLHHSDGRSQKRVLV